MPNRPASAAIAIGFMTVVEHQPHGLFGGFLVVDVSGRPLEFHCTAPVKTNRAQEILFGPTLPAYLYGEQIGHTLFASAKQRPLLTCTDSRPVLALRKHVDVPVVLVEPAATADAGGEEGEKQLRLDAAHPASPRLLSFSLGRHCLAVDGEHGSDQSLAIAQLQPLAARWDLSEPFTRIREAIDEAQRSGR